MNTLTLACHLAAALSGLLLSAAATAQTTPPAWTNALAVAASNDTDADASRYTAFDAAGNRYEAGDFTGRLNVGSATYTSKGDYDCYMAKFSPAGDLVWSQQLGSSGGDFVSGLALDAAGIPYITGTFSGNIALNSGQRLEETAAAGAGVAKSFVIRYSTQGAAEWTSQSTTEATGADIGVDALGHVYATGLSATSSLSLSGGTTLATAAATEGVSVFLLRLNAATGVVQMLNSPFTFVATPAGTFLTDPLVAVGSTGLAYVVSDFEGAVQLPDKSTLTSAGGLDVVIIRTGPGGQLEWGKRYGTAADDEVSRGRVDAAGNLYLAGSSNGPIGEGALTLPNAGSYDGLLLKYDGTGALAWARSIGGQYFDGFADVLLDAGGNPYVTGVFSERIVFGSRTLTSAGDYDALVAAYTAQGQPRWIQQTGGPGDAVGGSLGFDALGNLYVDGQFDGNVAFGPYTLTPTLNAITTFVARLGNAVLGTAAARPLALGLAPNPATSRVRLSGLPAGQPIEVFDGLGRLVRTATLPPDATLSVQGLAPGLYLLRARDAHNRPYAGRLVVE